MGNQKQFEPQKNTSGAFNRYSNRSYIKDIDFIIVFAKAPFPQLKEMTESEFYVLFSRELLFFSKC